jgi:nucleoid-associated protein YgaU
MPTAVGISTLSGPAPLRGTAFPEFQGAPAGEAAPKAPKRRKPSAGHLPEKAGLAAPKVQPLNVPEFTSEPRRIYRVEPGDTLSTIAQRFYGDGKKWVKIYEANKERIEKGIVKPGQRIIIP